MAFRFLTRAGGQNTSAVYRDEALRRESVWGEWIFFFVHGV